jgi:nucleotidyltransferase substrate binding protein (TIGR01987 family)
MAPVTEEFKKAVLRLQDALAQPKNEFIRDSVIQRFEFSIELAWKTSKKIMGTATTAPKDIVREMAQAGYISDVQTWLLAIDMRNLSSHTYKEVLAEQVYGFVQNFISELTNLSDYLEKK